MPSSQWKPGTYLSLDFATYSKPLRQRRKFVNVKPRARQTPKALGALVKAMPATCGRSSRGAIKTE
jgi:hypothetical protein